VNPTHDQAGGASGASTAARPYLLRRLGVVMRPRPGDPSEAGGVLNPGGERGRDGAYYLFPRIVAQGNFSRIGIAKVIYDAAGEPCDVERLGVALSPEAPYELNRISGGGCEDPRVTYVPALGCYVMAYAAFGPHGPRAALAVSADLATWSRQGLVDFAPVGGASMNIYGNKDVMLFPDVVAGPDGRPSLAMLHRPMYELWQDTGGELTRSTLPPPGVDELRWSVWISFCPLDRVDWAVPGTQGGAPRFDTHRLLIAPDRPWESVRIGGGTPPIRLPEGWFTIYHGIGPMPLGAPGRGIRYSAGALVLDAADPLRVLYRSPEPILEPSDVEERAGVVSDVVFPTAIEQHERYLDVYYGMADSSIGVARMDLLAASPT